jgi:cytochrome c biogenesis protein CcmG, thiol:disulfide interchange protein DsbE
MMKHIWKLIYFGVMLAAIAILIQRLPAWYRLNQAKGNEIRTFEVTSLDGQSHTLPSGQRQVLIFWATWCPPCEMELARFNSAIEDGDLPMAGVVAISVNEHPKLVREVSQKRGYKLTVMADPHGNSLNSLEIAATPTTYHIDETGKVVHASTGVSPLGIMRAKRFLHDAGRSH